MTRKASSLDENDNPSNLKSSPKEILIHGKRKTSYKQGNSHLQMGTCDNEGKSIFTSSYLDEAQVLSIFVKCAMLAEFHQWA